MRPALTSLALLCDFPAFLVNIVAPTDASSSPRWIQTNLFLSRLTPNNAAAYAGTRVPFWYVEVLLSSGSGGRVRSLVYSPSFRSQAVPRIELRG